MTGEEGEASSLPYPIFVERGASLALGEIVRKHAPAHRTVVISDTTVAALHGASVKEALERSSGENEAQNGRTDRAAREGEVPILTIPPGEEEKTRERWSELTDSLLAMRCGRDTTVVALGGGVVCDLAGFVAATYMRGIGVVQVPTTLLAMVDASVGSKTGVDTPYGKNLIGAFHDPSAVVIDPTLLESLPAPLFRSGLAEVIKHGIIRDAAYLERVSASLDELTTRFASSAALAEIIRDSILIKADVVSRDKRESGLRKILNFGHTIAHALERASNYALAHGDAVAVGMVVESRMSELAGIASQGLTDAIVAILSRAGLPIRLSQVSGTFSVGYSTPRSLVELTRSDKKARSDAVRYSVPVQIGSMYSADGDYSVIMTDKLVETALSES